MKKNEFMKLISATQDNNVLVKESSEDDFLSTLIRTSIINHTCVESLDVDVSSIKTDIAYAISQLSRAAALCDKILNKEVGEAPGEEIEFDIPVTRIGYAHATIRVKARSQEEAEERALDEAGSYDFSEKSSDYELDK